MKISEKVKLKIYSIICISLGVMVITTIIASQLFITQCFPDEYRNESILVLLHLTLLVGGILIWLHRNFSKILLRIFSLGLVLDVLLKVTIFSNSFLENDLETKLIIIAVELIASLSIFLISTDRAISCNEMNLPNINNNQILDFDNDDE